MWNRKGVTEAALCAVLAMTGLARATDTTASIVTNGSSPDYAQSHEPFRLDAEAPAGNPVTTPLAAPTSAPVPPPPTPHPLMNLISHTGAKDFFDNTRLSVYGFFEGGYTYSASAPPGNMITGNVFNTSHEEPILDQADITIERTLDLDTAVKNHSLDIGGHAEMIYGYDTKYFHSNGLFDYYHGTEYQWDLNQAYVDIGLPIGNGLDIRIGKIVTLLGYEVINPTGNPFYSHSYLFGYAIPFTNTGVFGIYNLNDQWSVEGGVSRGWNQSLKDNNGAVDAIGQITYTPDSKNEKNTKIALAFTEGPEAAHDNHDYWTVLDLVAAKQLNAKTTVAVNADYGDAPHGLGPTSAQWFGAALYGQYILNDYVTLNARGEWYDDNNGFTLGVGRNMQVYEATLGATITPAPNNDYLKWLQFRPEVRVDYANHPYFDGATDRYQVQFAIDAIYQF